MKKYLIWTPFFGFAFGNDTLRTYLGYGKLSKMYGAYQMVCCVLALLTLYLLP